MNQLSHSARGLGSQKNESSLLVLRIHDSRQTAASWLVNDGGPLEVIKELFERFSTKVTEHYAHLSPQGVLKQ